MTDDAAAVPGLTFEQLSILRDGVHEWLVAKSEDLLRATEDEEGLRPEVEEIAALCRLASALEGGTLAAPDPLVRDLIAKSTTETIHLNHLKEEYDQELAEHEAWLALLAGFDETRGGRGGER